MKELDKIMKGLKTTINKSIDSLTKKANESQKRFTDCSTQLDETMTKFNTYIEKTNNLPKGIIEHLENCMNYYHWEQFASDIPIDEHLESLNDYDLNDSNQLTRLLGIEGDLENELNCCYNLEYIQDIIRKINKIKY